MNIFNSIELINDDESHVLNTAFIFSMFTLSLFFNIFLYFGFEDNNFYILVVNGLFLSLYIVSKIFFKNALKVLSTELFSMLLALCPFFFAYFYFGNEIFGNFIFLLIFISLFILVDFSVFFIKNRKSIGDAINTCFEGRYFNYAYREECRVNLLIKRSFLSKAILVLFCLIAPFLLLFGKSLPYVFFGLFGGNIEVDHLVVGCFITLSLLAFLSLNYIYLFILYLYYFLKIVYQNRSGINNI